MIPTHFSENAQDLWAVADHFRHWVCSTLREFPESDLAVLRGDYLFIVDTKPRFIVLIDQAGAWSLTLLQVLPTLQFKLEEKSKTQVTTEQINNIIDSSARAVVLTDSTTLSKLLLGNLKARTAFLSGLVTIKGDLPAFMKMVSFLKQKRN